MPTSHSDALWRLATTRWAEITAISPDLAPAVMLQQRLLRLMIDAASALEQAPPPSFPWAAVADKWARGLPALRNERIAIPPALKDVLGPLCKALADGGAGESAVHIGDAIAAGDIDADSLLAVSLARNQKAIRTSALHMGFSPDLVWLIGELASAPLAYRLSAGLKASTTTEYVTGLKDRTTTEYGTTPTEYGTTPTEYGTTPTEYGTTGGRPDLLGQPGIRTPDLQLGDPTVRRADLQVGQWDRGYCPLCGSWPVLIESLGVAHILRCSYCALDWTLQSHGCVYCRNTGEDFVSAAPDVRAPEQRVELCGRCSGYTKVIDVRALTPFPLLAIEDLATMQLDQGAMDRGYRRPELFDLDTIQARTSTC